MNPLIGHPALSNRFADLTQCLHQYRHLWEPRPFVSLSLPWEQEHPEVSAWAQALPEAAIDAMEQGSLHPDAGLACPALYRAWWQRTQELTAIGPLPRTSLDLPQGWAGKQLRWRIPARKWQQIVAFGEAVVAMWPHQLDGLVDWCAGKGHVGRTLGHQLGCPVWAIERQPHLCEQGREMAARLQRPGFAWQAQIADVLTPEGWSQLGPTQGAVALHACGVLTHTLLREGVARGVRAFAASPCCPHFVAGEASYPPMSQAAQSAALPLPAKLLRLAIADEILASPRERQLRRKEMAYRLGLDLLWREATGLDQYHSAGNLPKGVLRLSFADFCESNAARLQRPLPARWSPLQIEQQAWILAQEARGRALIRALFRRPLELWLVLDRALFLAEHGYHVSLGSFCPTLLTPRNLMMTAVLSTCGA